MTSSQNGGNFGKKNNYILKVYITKIMCAKFYVKIWLGSDFRQGGVILPPPPPVKLTTIKKPVKNRLNGSNSKNICMF